MLLFSLSWVVDGGPNETTFGRNVAAAGDLNGDGFGDVVVGADGYANPEQSEGAVFVYHGTVTGLYGTEPAWMVESNVESASLGSAVAGVGDVDGDGFADVGVGAVGWTGGEIGEGRAFVWRGTAYGLEAEPDWGVEVNQASAMVGAAIASAGDVNGDGYADVIVGGHGYDGGETNEGAAWLHLGSVSGLRFAAAWTAEGGAPDVNLGYDLAPAGDVNADGYDDVVVGSAGAFPVASRAELYLGSADGLEATAAWTGSGTQVDDLYGWSVSGAGDVDADGYDDVIVGAQMYDGDFTDQGAAFVYHGSSTGLSLAADWTGQGSQADGLFGSAVAGAGDVNADGYDDVIVGAQSHDAAGFVDNGRVTVYLGSADGLATRAIFTADGPADSGANFGHAVGSAGDVQGDGLADVIVGAPFAGPFGRVTVFYGGFATDSDGDGVLDDLDLCVGDDDSGDDDLDGICANGVDGSTLDCDDANPDSYPGAPELCDGHDNVCAGEIRIVETDLDADGSFPCGGDCDDNDATAGSNVAETCEDQVDNDCDGDVDEGCAPDGATTSDAPADSGCSCATTAPVTRWASWAWMTLSALSVAGARRTTRPPHPAPSPARRAGYAARRTDRPRGR
jgi:hypothetical protein